MDIEDFVRPILHLPDDLIRDFLFHELYDTQRDGVIELYEFMENMVLFKNEHELVEGNQGLVQKGNRSIPKNVEQLIERMKEHDSIRMSEETRLLYREMFKKLDINRDGWVDKNEFMKFVKKVREQDRK